MLSTEELGQIASEAAKRFSQRVFVSAETAESLNTNAPKSMAPKPTKGEVFRANAQAKDRTRALIAEAETTTDPASQLDAIRKLSQERVIGTPDFKDVNYMEFAIAVARGVARVRLRNGFGTGSLVGPRLLLTNNHVIEDFDVARTAIAEFDHQDDMNGNRLQLQSFTCDPDTFFYTNRDLDFTVVALRERSDNNRPISDYPWTRLIGTTGKTDKGLPVNIIQHPQGGLKQIVFRNNEIIEIPDGKSDFLYYTSDTEPGSSGSPCFTDSWDMVALHHASVPQFDADGQFQRWIANEGVRVSAMVAALKEQVFDPKRLEILNEMLDAKAPNPIEIARQAAGGRSGVVLPPTPPTTSPGTPIAFPGGTATWTIPLQVQVSLGQVGSFGSTNSFGPSGGNNPPIFPSPKDPVPSADRDDTAQEGLIVDPYSVHRDGYNEDFLEGPIPIPLPSLSESQREDSVVVLERYRNREDPFVLDYHYYSVAMCKSRRFAWYSAANVDGDNRPQLPKRSGDRWHIDPRIEPEPKRPIYQLGEELYSADKTDRGHLTRYLDLAWGTKEQALSAMADTFHFTNCTLQLSVFNQNASRWQGIERFLLEEHARKEKRRIIVMTGPILKENELAYRNPKMKVAALVPVSFWKICVIVRKNQTMSATAFVLDQKDLKDLPGIEEAAFNVKPTQVTIAELERRTGLNFGPLRELDHFASGGPVGTLEEMTRKDISEFSDIVVD